MRGRDGQGFTRPRKRRQDGMRRYDANDFLLENFVIEESTRAKIYDVKRACFKFNTKLIRME